MKCDELEEMVLEDGIGQMCKCYDVEEVKEAIAELKEFAEDACLERDDNQTAIDELLKEIESLKASHYAEMVDAGMRERRLRRALWIARANRAESQWNRLLRDSGICFAVGKNKEWDLLNQKQKKWQEVERKCRAKAEQYK